jgi:hypothetical protein
MKYAVNAIKRFAQSTPAWKSFIVGPYGAFANTTTDAELVFYIRNNSDTCVFQLPTSAREPILETAFAACGTLAEQPRCLRLAHLGA